MTTDNNPINVQEQGFLIANLNATPGAGGFLENELQIRRRRRVHGVIDRQLMPEAPQPDVNHRRRPVAPRSVQPQPDAAVAVPLVRGRRPRGRPRRIALEAPVPVEITGPAVPQVPAPAITPTPEPVPLVPIAPQPADNAVAEVPTPVPTRRPRGRPRRRALEAPVLEKITGSAAQEVAIEPLPDVPVRRREPSPQAEDLMSDVRLSWINTRLNIDICDWDKNAKSRNKIE